jgi:DNA (cytosine-5)-methyltransferase 1
MTKKPDWGITVTDQFCGAGGSSLGASHIGMTPLLALNHWQKAIDTHQTNFPDTLHDCTDVQSCDPRRYPSTDGLITSPECTNHSLAKGVKRSHYATDLFGNPQLDPASERSRATMWDVPRFAEYHRYNFIVVENVVDAANWILFDPWLHAMHALGYEHEVVYFNSMFAPPTPQSRDRMYVVFWRKGNPKPDLEFRPPAYCGHCEKNVEGIQTWKKPRRWGRYRRQYIYRCATCHKEVTPYYFAAMNIIDWRIQAERIGERKRPLQPKTLARIRYGLEAYGRQPLIVTGKYTSGIESRVRPAASEVLPTQPGESSHALLSPYFLDLAHAENKNRHVYSPAEGLFTQTACQSAALVAPGFLSRQYENGHHNATPLSEAARTVTTWDHHAYIGIGGFLSKQRGIGYGHSLGDATGTIVSNDTHALVGVPPMLVSVNDYDPRVLPSDSEPLGTQTTQDKWAAAFPPAFIAEMHGTSMAKGLADELMCVTTGRNHALLSSQAFFSYYYGTLQGSGLADPLHTVTALDRAALVQALESLTVEDLTFRMLTPDEIGRAMAFPGTYVVLGTKKEQTKQYGNAVTPPVMAMLLERCRDTLNPRQV